ncbi:MAG: histidine kinase [Thermoanaerobaculia bacterium]|nr:histidine kinase [Thermoanaerobaculia bacterium]
MHPILRDRSRLAIYLTGWLFLGGGLALVVAGPRAEHWLESSLLLVPLFLLYSFVCLAAWYPARANPLGRTGVLRISAVHLVGAIAAAALWQLVGRGWAEWLERLRPGLGTVELHRDQVVFFFAAGVLLYLLAVAVHYLVLAFEASRQAESRALELKLLAQQAELEAFRAQIDPHFLFNSLNSISSLCGSDAEAARRTAIRLGEFLRSSLELRAAELIPLSEELALAAAYLDVERSRFGDRLVLEERIDPECLDRPVPALILQPLLENALKHGIAHLTERGRVAIRGLLHGRRLHLTVDSSCDPDRPRARSTGIGLDNVRGRLKLLYGGGGRLTTRDLGNSYRVEIVLPEETSAAAEAPTTAAGTTP